MRQIAVVVVTVLILAALGQAMRNYYWLIPLVPVGAVWLGYRLGSPYEKREFRVVVPRLLRRLGLRRKPPRLAFRSIRSATAPRLPRAGAGSDRGE